MVDVCRLHILRRCIWGVVRNPVRKKSKLGTCVHVCGMHGIMFARGHYPDDNSSPHHQLRLYDILHGLRRHKGVRHSGEAYMKLAGLLEKWSGVMLAVAVGAGIGMNISRYTWSWEFGPTVIVIVIFACAGVRVWLLRRWRTDHGGN